MRTAIIGAGRMGLRHLQVVRQLNLELVGIADPNVERLALAEQQYQVPKEQQFTETADLLEHTNPECVIVAPTAPTHAEYTGLAAEAGAKYILCEKPMAVSLAECDRMIESCRARGARLAINHQMRFMEQYTAPKRFVCSEEFGGLTSITVIGANFGMAMNGSHYFEMFRYMTDENPVEATAWFSQGKVPNPRGPQYEDRAGSVRVTTASGKRFYMEIGSDQGHGVLVVYAGHYGRLAVDELAGKMYTSVRLPEHRSQPTTRYAMPWTDTVRDITPTDAVAPSQAVLQALLNDADYPTGEQGRLAVSVLVAAYVSDENGHRSVAIDENLPRDRVFPWA